MQEKIDGNAPGRWRAEAVTSSPAGGWGWYLYGIMQLFRTGEPQPAIGDGLDARAPVEMLRCGDLAAVVSRVPLAELGAEAVRVRLQDAIWLEAMVRGHERVVETAHRLRTILPAKFGSVYASPEELLAAVEQTHDMLLARLEQLEGCDEWGVRVYAHHPTIRRRVTMEDTQVLRLQQDLATASPGRAYLLQRKLADLLAVTTDQALCSLAQAGYDHLARYAIAGHIGHQPDLRRGLRDEVELLRAAFLISRPTASAFAEEIRRFTEGEEGLRCEYSGPWPPYNFVAADEGDSSWAGSGANGVTLEERTHPEGQR